MVNNWDTSGELDVFRLLFIDPLKVKVDEAREIFRTTKWKDEAQKERGRKKFQEMETKLIDLSKFHRGVKDLILHHERQTDMLTEIYAQWYHKISKDGLQPSEMMDMQAKFLQEIFQRIFDAIEPLGLSTIKPPQNDKDSPKE